MNDRNLPAIGTAVLRVALGVMYVAHAWLKIAVFTPAGTVQFFQSIGLPGALAWATIAAELLGGIALIVGLGTRWVAAALLAPLFGALALVHWDKGWLFTNAGGGWEYVAFLIAASVTVILQGSGAFALEARRANVPVQPALARC